MVDVQIGKTMVEDDEIYVFSIRDITERKMIEQERLRISQERFLKIFQSSPNLISINSLTEGNFIDVNPSWLEFTGYEYHEISSLSFNSLKLTISSMNRDAASELVELEDTSIRNARVNYMTKSGEMREGLLSSEIIEIDGAKCILAVITDITETVLLEKEMARLDRLNLVGEMAAGIAHEIRNPMTTVRGFLQMSKRNVSATNPKYIDIMLDELDRANAIITEFLTLAKNKQNDFKFQDLSDLVQMLSPLIQAEASLSGKGVEISLEKGLMLYLDEKEIRQMVLNLALNGLDAMSIGKTLKIKTYQQEEQFILEVEDQGCGIPDEIIDRIGTPFFTTKDNGTGLGLAVCFSVAARHNATIEVQSGQAGTTFSVRFPQNNQPIKST